jgi:hypothetical protein
MRFPLAVAASVLAVIPAAANAQSNAGCDGRRPPAVGVAVGRSSPYFEPTGDIATASRGFWHLAARADLPIAGAWRARVEGATTEWRLERTTYSADLREVVAREIVGHLDVRHVAGLIGRQLGRAPACAYVLAGGGLYALDYRGAHSFKPGTTLVAGIELPASSRGAIQVDAQVHIVDTGPDGLPPIGSSAVLDGRLAIAWVFRLRR